MSSPPADAPGQRRATVLVVSPRPPRPDGQGDQRRANELVGALSEEWEVDIVSWLPDVDRSGARRWLANPRHFLRALRLSLVMSVQVAYVQGRAPSDLRTTVEGYDAVVFVTNRAVPRRIPGSAVVDFVDDLGGMARRRALSSSLVGALFWRLEARRVEQLDRRLAATARLCVAHSAADAAAIGQSVGTIPLSVGTRPTPESGDKVVFVGNLFYAPNHEAATWICTELVPRLQARGMDSADVVIAGRRPRPALRAAALTAGVELRADVADLSAVPLDAAVVVAPMRLGTGAQYKVLDAVGAGRACVLSPLANAGLELVDGESALVREREPEPFADAVASLLADPCWRRRLADEALRRVADYLPESVAQAWRATVRRVVSG